MAELLPTPGLDAHVTRLEGPAPELDIAHDLARRAVPVAPALLLIAGLLYGPGGAASAAVAIGLVVVNFVLAARIMAWAVKVSLAALYGAVLGGYILRLALITAAVLAIKDLSWVELVPLGFTLIVTHLGLLVWETRHVSMTLAYPGLAPKPGRAGVED